MHRKRTLWIAGLLCLLLAALFLIVRNHYGKAAAAQPRAAAVVAVVRGNLASSLTVAGQFQPYQQVDLHAKVSGYIPVSYTHLDVYKRQVGNSPL